MTVRTLVQTLVLRRLSVVSSRTFDAVLERLGAGIARPDTSGFRAALAKTKSRADLEELVRGAVGSSPLMEFARFDLGRVLAAEHGGAGPRLVRLVVGNPLVMKKLVEGTRDAGSYAPVTILVDERSDGVHVSYDATASFLAPYASEAALSAARELDAQIERLLEVVAR